jgi:hypothetical protein
MSGLRIALGGVREGFWPAMTAEPRGIGAMVEELTESQRHLLELSFEFQIEYGLKLATLTSDLLRIAEITAAMAALIPPDHPAAGPVGTPPIPAPPDGSLRLG